jgi:hypothetical protein
LLLFVVIMAQAQQLEFPRETINFTIDSIHFTVDGFYYFKNPTNKKVSSAISYPFPHGSAVVDSSWVYDCSKLMRVPFIKGKNDLHFSTSAAPLDTPVVRIGYREKHDGKTAQYILTTTKFWNRPLVEASYSLSVPAYITITSFSYEPDTTIKQANGTLYLFRKKNFMPVKDFIVTFMVK